MKSRTIDVILSLAIVLILSIYFFMMHLYNSNLSIVKQLDDTKKYIEEEKWNKAVENSYEINKKWDNIRLLIMLNYAEEDMSTMEEHINRLISGTETKDDTTALTNVLSIKDLFNNMNQLVPRP